MKNKRFLKKIAHVLLASAFFSLTIFAQDCSECKKEATEIQQKTNFKERAALILKKNQDYMAAHPNAPESLAIKVRSNIIVTMMQIETSENEITLLQGNLKTKGCSKCPN